MKGIVLSSILGTVPPTPLFLPPAAGHARGISVPQLGMEPMLPAVEVQSLNPWTTKEVLQLTVLVEHIFDGAGTSSAALIGSEGRRGRPAHIPPASRRESRMLTFHHTF